MSVVGDLKAEDILTIQQLADRLQVPKCWVYGKTRQRGRVSGNPFPVLRLGRHLRFSWSDVLAWMRGNEGK